MRFLLSRYSPRGFTLIELLVVIAIIGILSSVVLASLNTARLKSRDARRLSDMRQLQTALALFYDTCNKYPVDIYAAYNTCLTGGLGGATSPYISSVPKDPLGSNYMYAGIDLNGSGFSCETYHLGATLEDANNPALAGAARAGASGTPCVGAGDFTGTGAIYDVKP